ncbi:cytochrome b/b6 domain-containing protein [Actinomadura oligospora]|uniref:cytochrome b/b6 domain-containing protein n=1 Tax=Actinomadura oligospora TaxID=111804 RepID=UPI0004B133EF|nr:cytochrome b/b6 domain-containing protein [Actinomadura oligospora]
MRRPDGRDGHNGREGHDRREGHARGLLVRFTLAERWVHHLTALLMLACLVTAFMLYIPAFATMVGHREIVKPVHIYCGLLLPVPTLLGLASRAFRLDLGRLDRFGPHDGPWLRSGRRRAVVDGRGVVPVGKFNAGQKLNAAFTAGAALIMLGTGAMLTWPDPWPDRWRTGATFVHDWLFLVIAVVTLGHLWEAFRDPGALRGMATGRVTGDWAARHHAAWFDASGGASEGVSGVGGAVDVSAEARGDGPPA